MRPIYTSEMSEPAPDNPNDKLETLLRQWGVAEAMDGLDVPEMPLRNGGGGRPLRFVLTWLPPAAAAAMLVVSSVLFYNAWRMSAPGHNDELRLSERRQPASNADGRNVSGLNENGRVGRPGGNGRTAEDDDESADDGKGPARTAPGWGRTDNGDFSPAAGMSGRGAPTSLSRGRGAHKSESLERRADDREELTGGSSSFRSEEDVAGGLAISGEDGEVLRYRRLLAEREREIAELRDELRRHPGGAPADGVAASRGRQKSFQESEAIPDAPEPRDEAADALASSAVATGDGSAPTSGGDRSGAVNARLRRRIEQLEGELVEQEAALARAKRDHAEEVKRLRQAAPKATDRSSALASRRSVDELRRRVDALERLQARQTAAIQRVYLATQAPLRQGIEARVEAARAARLADRCRRLAKVAETGDQRSLLNRLEVVLLRLDLLDVSDRSAVASFRRSAWTDELAGRVREGVLAADETETAALLSEVRMVLWGLDDVD